MRASRASLAVRHRLESLDRGLEVSLDTDAEGLHRARVATRRLREALPLVVPAAGSSAGVTEFRHVVRDATRALGGVREIDVALSVVDGLAADHPDLARELAHVREAMTGERAARLEHMRRRLDAAELQRASRELADRLGRFTDDRHPAELLADRLAARIEALRRAVRDAGLLYATERLHRVRLATKKLRYVLELVGEMRIAPTRRLVNNLRRVQDGLGRLHDLEIVQRAARQALGSVASDEPGAPLLSLLEEKIHTQHAEYLALRKRLAEVIDQAAVLGEHMAGTHAGA